MQYLVMVKATEASEVGRVPSKDDANGLRIDFSGAKPHVIGGPFAETKELAELVERLLPCPFRHGEQIEIRQFHEPEGYAGIA